MKKRLFIAVPLPDKIKKELSYYKRCYKEQIKEKDIRWVSTQNLHITLCFLGSVEQDKINTLISKLTSVLLKIKVFQLRFEKILFVPLSKSSNKKPNMIWAQFKKNKNYEHLVSIIYKNLSSQYFNPNKIIPHVTLARFKNFLDTSMINLKQPKVVLDFDVDKCHLMESELNSDGPNYSIIATFFFRKDVL